MIISTHAPLAGRDLDHRVLLWHAEPISTHAPLAGRDLGGNSFIDKIKSISTHAPLAGRDRNLGYQSLMVRKFQPTRPLRGATRAVVNVFAEVGISTHAPLAGRDSRLFHQHAFACISTHAPLAGRDRADDAEILIGQEFQPTRPLRGATKILTDAERQKWISTHAPLAGRDRSELSFPRRAFYFNPRAPCGARLYVSIVDADFYKYFNPRAPCGARPVQNATRDIIDAFQPTRPLRGATQSPAPGPARA